LAPEPKDGREVRRPGAREEVYKRSGAAVVKAKQRVQLNHKHTAPSHPLFVPIFSVI
jgi:hypothetical protein